MADEITLDRQTFEALAIDTRIDILKSLQKRRKTQSELSKELKLAVSTISEHLKKMENAGLVRRKKQGKKWVYYELTEKGSHIVNPKSKTVFVFALSMAIVLMFLGTYLMSFTGAIAGAPMAAGSAADSLNRQQIIPGGDLGAGVIVPDENGTLTSGTPDNNGTTAGIIGDNGTTDEGTFNSFGPTDDAEKQETEAQNFTAAAPTGLMISSTVNTVAIAIILFGLFFLIGAIWYWKK